MGEIWGQVTSIKDTLLDLLDTGTCTIKYTRKPSFAPGKNVTEKYVFKRCVFVGTSNLYQQMIIDALSKGNDATRIEDDFRQFNQTGDSSFNFSPEFLGRFSRNIIPFGPVERGNDFQRLIQIEMYSTFNRVRKSLKCKVRADNESQVLAILENQLYGDGTNTRNVAAYFKQSLESAITHNFGTINLEGKEIVLAPVNETSLQVKVFAPVLGKMEEDKTRAFTL